MLRKRGAWGCTVVRNRAHTHTHKIIILFLGCDVVTKPNLSVRLRKVYGFYTVLSLFRTENCGLCCVFSTVFFPPSQDTLKL
jgi:hypothetical protein